MAAHLEQTAVQVLRKIQHGLETIGTCDKVPRRSRHPCTHILLSDQQQQALRERCHVPWGHEKTGRSVLDHLGHTPDISRNNGSLHRHGLSQTLREPFSSH